MSTSRIDRIAALALVAAAAGCNALFGLDATATDGDGDGIPDALDNCPLDPNPNQLDADHDGVGNACQCALINVDLDGDGVDDGCDDCIGAGPLGVDTNGDGIDDGCEFCPTGHGADADGDGIDDACDACPLGPPHDEDHDGIVDACDNCPTVANADQSNGDGDALGDACDIPGTQVHSTMDGFGVQDPTLWSGAVPTWEWLGDQLVAMSTPAIGAPRRVSALSITGASIVETRVTVEVGSGNGMIEIPGAGSSWTCSVDADRMLLLNLLTDFGPSTSAMAGPVEGTGPVRLRFVSSASGHIQCQGRADTGVASIAELDSAQQPRGRVALVSGDGVTRFDYLWVGSE